mmetsp:Transcript_4699/g.6805  ORF Transcript_4699/g.6805 Transcript_4699/m.6805 type:complete len:116 (+) Transcript_4699:111-458(+)
MGTPKKIREESWSSFHKKHGSPESYFSCSSPICYDGSMFDDDDDSQGGKGWFTSVLDTLAGIHFNDNNSAMKGFLSDDSSTGSPGNTRRRINLRRKKKNVGSKKQGNIRISNFSR